MKLTTLLATAFAFSAIAADSQTWLVSGTKPLVLPGWGTVSDPYGMARFAMNGSALSVEIAGGGVDYANGNHVAPVVLQEVEGDFEVSVAIQPGINPDGTSTHANRILWNAAGLLVEWDKDNFARLELCVRQPIGKKEDNRVWAHRVVNKNWKWDEPSIKGANAERPLFLRIQRTGPQIKWAHSFDKETWTELEPFSAGEWPKKLKVGVLFVNLTTKVEKATVSDLKITKLSTN
jgi:regulation of enolase protein 1 (concanavalin A-like superfamily)